MISPLHYEDKFTFNINKETKRGIFTNCSIADIHFGVIEARTQYNILEEQFLNKIDQIKFDMISIPGDIFQKRTMGDTDANMYATKFISKLVIKCKRDNTTLVIIKGTRQHDADLLKLFYHYLSDPDIDIRIVENISFEYIKGVKILCIPELYGLDENIYRKFLFESGVYDMCLMHGTIETAVYGNNVGQGRLFTINDFSNCLGPIISGHIHTGGCFFSHFYYTGSPIRYSFGEEGEKGFLISLHDLDSRKYYIHLEPIKSFRYDTVNLDELISSDPKDIISYINELKDKENIDYLRIEFKKDIPTDNLEILKSYYKNNGTIKFKLNNTSSKVKKELLDSEDQELYEKFIYLFDTSMSEYDKLAKFINENEGYMYITGDQIKELVEEI